MNVMRGNISTNVSLSCCSNCTINSTMIFHSALDSPAVSQKWLNHVQVSVSSPDSYRGSDILQPADTIEVGIGFSWISCGFCLKGYQTKSKNRFIIIIYHHDFMIHWIYHCNWFMTIHDSHTIQNAKILQGVAHFQTHPCWVLGAKAEENDRLRRQGSCNGEEARRSIYLEMVDTSKWHWKYMS